MSDVVTRFAPSPTGHLHIGGARTAIFCWLLARHYGGRFHLRIEDTDLLRSKQEYTDSILASMRWLGLDWDGGLTYQTRRTDLYNSYVDKLLETGHAYWCSCTPEEVEAMREEARQNGLKPRYNGHCRTRDLGPGEGRCVRLKTPLTGKVVFDDMVKGKIAVDVGELDDMVIRRADGMPTYNMAVVVDDHEMGITHVIRGDDHVSNTPRQILIYEALGLPVPRFRPCAHDSGPRPPEAFQAPRRRGRSLSTRRTACCPRPWSVIWCAWAGPTAIRSCSAWTSWCGISTAATSIRRQRPLTRPNWNGATPTSCANCPWTSWPHWWSPLCGRPVWAICPGSAWNLCA